MYREKDDEDAAAGEKERGRPQMRFIDLGIDQEIQEDRGRYR